MRELYLHVGSPKTGTTSIQNYLSCHRDVLFKNYGVLYPKAGLNVIAHHPLAADVRAKFNGDKIPDHCYGDNPRDKNWEKLLVELNGLEKKIKKVIVSSEDFFTLFRTGNIEPLKYIRDVLHDFDVKIVFYLRRQDFFVDSLYNQAIKATLQCDLLPGDFIDKHPVTRKNYFEILDAWGRVFGVDNVFIRPFEREELLGGSLIDDFLSIVGVDADVGQDYLQPKNERLSPEELVFKNEINKSFSDNLACISFFEKIRSVHSPEECSKRLSMHKSDYERLVECSSIVNKKIEDTFLHGNKLFGEFPALSEVGFLDPSDLKLESYFFSLVNKIKSWDFDVSEIVIMEKSISHIFREYGVSESVRKEIVERLASLRSSKGLWAYFARFCKKVGGVFIKCASLIRRAFK